MFEYELEFEWLQGGMTWSARLGKLEGNFQIPSTVAYHYFVETAPIFG